MKARLLFLFKYWLLWILFFEGARVAFLLSNSDKTAGLPFSGVIKTLWYGMRMDAAVAAYITVPVCLLIIASVFFEHLRKPAVYLVYTGLLLTLAIVITAADIPLFRAWGYRLDASALRYLSNPKEAWASSANQPLLQIAVLAIAAGLVAFLVFKKMITAKCKRILEVRTRPVSALVLLLATACFVLPIRGGWQSAPLNQSSVYFSKNNFLNLAAVNASFNLLHSLSKSKAAYGSDFRVFSAGELASLTGPMSDAGADSTRLVAPGTKPNVILIIWESFTAKAVDTVHRGVVITPNFNRYKNEGIYFSNVYASGDRTDKGIAAILSGYPAQPLTSIIKIPSKASKLPMLPKDFASAGYHTAFFYGGDPDFANMESYLSQANFDRFATIDDFTEDDRNSKWGAHDGAVANMILRETQQMRQPHFTTWLTLSSHEPFETPVPDVITGDDDESMFLNSMHYTDSIVYRFIQTLKSGPQWKNTLIIICGDHGHPLPRTGKRINDFQSPLLFLGGALTKWKVDPAVTSQTDLAATLLGGLGMDFRNYTFSRNLLNTRNSRFAYFSFSNGFGFVDSSGYTIHDNVGRQPIEGSGVGESLIRQGKARQQQTLTDYQLK